MKNILPIAASAAILAVAVPFAANQWNTFSTRNATWKESAELERLKPNRNSNPCESQLSSYQAFKDVYTTELERGGQR
jgi:hypothetical protein